MEGDGKLETSLAACRKTLFLLRKQPEKLLFLLKGHLPQQISIIIKITKITKPQQHVMLQNIHYKMDTLELLISEMKPI